MCVECLTLICLTGRNTPGSAACAAGVVAVGDVDGATDWSWGVEDGLAVESAGPANMPGFVTCGKHPSLTA